MHKPLHLMNIATQIMLPLLTLSGQYAYAIKAPEWGLVINMIAQPFWLYSAWKAYKDAGQLGILINSIIFTFITAWGIINYWL